MQYKIVISLFIFLSIYKSVHPQAPAIQWQKSFGGSGQDEMYQGAKKMQTADGGFIFIGWTESTDGDLTVNHGGRDLWVVRTNSAGGMQWQKTFGGTNTDAGNSIEQTTDGGFIIAGSTQSGDGDVTYNHGNGSADVWVLKLDQLGNLQWQNTYGGTANDAGYAIHPTPDGGYIVGATTFSVNDGDVTGFHGYADFWALKIDVTGNLQWQKTLGGSDDDEGISIRLTNDGGFIMTGLSHSTDGDLTGNKGMQDMWLVKLNGAGNLLWQNNFGGSDQDVGTDVQQSIDGGYVVSGFTRSLDGDVTNLHGNFDYWVIKTDANGNKQWQKTYGGGSEDYCYNISPTNDGGFALSGFVLSSDGDVTNSNGAPHFWLVKITGAGILQWEKALGGNGNSISYGAQQTLDGGYIVAGHTNANDGDVSGNHGMSDFWVVKLAPNCNLSVSAGADEHLYFGYTTQQCLTKSAIVNNGTAPYTFTWSLSRGLLSDVITPDGDESMSNATASQVSLCLMDTAELCLTVIDAKGCSATDCAIIYAEDVRCFAGKSTQAKVNICHNGKQICVDPSAVPAHLGHGDNTGLCITTMSSARITNMNAALGEEFSIYVSPGSTNLTIHPSRNFIGKSGTVQVVNSMGQLIKQLRLSDVRTTEIQLPAAGIYYILIRSEKNTIYRKTILVQ